MNVLRLELDALQITNQNLRIERNESVGRARGLEKAADARTLQECVPAVPVSTSVSTALNADQGSGGVSFEEYVQLKKENKSLKLEVLKYSEQLISRNQAKSGKSQDLLSSAGTGAGGIQRSSSNSSKIRTQKKK